MTSKNGAAWYLYEKPKLNKKSTIWPACVLSVLEALALAFNMNRRHGRLPKTQRKYWSVLSVLEALAWRLI